MIHEYFGFCTSPFSNETSTGFLSIVVQKNSVKLPLWTSVLKVIGVPFAKKLGTAQQPVFMVLMVVFHAAVAISRCL